MIELQFHKLLSSPEGQMNLEVQTSIAKGEFLGLYGPSGAGKTSFLRILAGLLHPDAGLIRAGGVTWFDSAKRTRLRPQMRRAGIVFQDYALFPNMNVRRNIAFALPKDRRDAARVSELLELVGLGGLARQDVRRLSGGQQQRVALARALATDPDLLLLDEPLSALDPRMRRKLQDDIARIHRETGITIVLVSHDLAEIFRLADRVLVLDHGKVRRDGAPAEVFGADPGDLALSLHGKVVELIGEGEFVRVGVLVGRKVCHIRKPRSEAEGLEVGGEVLLSHPAEGFDLETLDRKGQ